TGPSVARVMALGSGTAASSAWENQRVNCSVGVAAISASRSSNLPYLWRISATDMMGGSPETVKDWDGRGIGLAQLTGEAEQPSVDDAVTLKGVGRLQNVIDAGPVTAMGGANNLQQLVLGQAAHVCGGVEVHGEGQRRDDAVFGAAVVPARNIGATGHFPAPEGIHDLRGLLVVDPKHHAAAGPPRIEPEDQAGALGCPPIDARPEAQRPVVAMQQGVPALHEFEFRSPDERAVSVNPNDLALRT